MNKKILLVDDEKEAFETVGRYLMPRGFDIVPAFDGDEGLSKFDSEQPDLILCDIKMPKKDGFEFLKDLRATRRWVPVIIISALTEPDNIMRGYGFEAEYYLTKPLNLEKLLRSVNVMLSLSPLRKK